MAERVRSRSFGAKNKKNKNNLISYPFIAKQFFLFFIFFCRHQQPKQSSTVQVRREGRGDNCVSNNSSKPLNNIKNNYNSIDKTNKNISN